MTATYLKLLVTMAVWGGTWVAARVVVQEVAPLAAATWRYFLSALSLVALLYWVHGGLPKLTRGEAWQVLALGASGIFLYNVCFLIGIQYIPAGHGALVVALNPVMVTLGAWWLLGESMTPAKALGSAIGLVGCLTVIGNGSPLAPLTGEVGRGDALILACAVFWSTYTLLSRRAMRTLSPMVSTAYASIAGWLMLLVTTLVVSPDALAPTYSLTSWAAILFLGLLGTTLGFIWFNQAIKRIGAARASIFINLVPLAAVLQGAWLLDERLGLPVLIGGLLVLAGVTLTQLQPNFLSRQVSS